MHSTEQLKKQYEAACDRLRIAEVSKRDAKKAYLDKVIADALADYAAKGIVPGGKAVLVRKAYFGSDSPDERIVVGFLGFEEGWSIERAKPVFSKLMNDGTPSKSAKYFHFETVEPFNAENSNAQMKSEEA
jgi:hypothetical protein